MYISIASILRQIVRGLLLYSLAEMLPFEDNYFDHVRIARIGWGVGEMQARSNHLFL
jgi:hypothetical protein